MISGWVSVQGGISMLSAQSNMPISLQWSMNSIKESANRNQSYNWENLSSILLSPYFCGAYRRGRNVYRKDKADCHRISQKE